MAAFCDDYLLKQTENLCNDGFLILSSVRPDFFAIYLYEKRVETDRKGRMLIISRFKKIKPIQTSIR